PTPAELDTLSLHDALPIFEQEVLDPDDCAASEEERPLDDVAELADVPGPRVLLEARHGLGRERAPADPVSLRGHAREVLDQAREDRKSTRLNSSHLVISYA